MNSYFHEIPEEISHLIFSYLEIDSINLLSKKLKLYVNYEQLCYIREPEFCRILKQELYKYYELPDYYLIYKDLNLFNMSTDDLLSDEHINNLDNIHTFNYVCLYRIYLTFPETFKILEKYPKHYLKYPTILYGLLNLNNKIADSDLLFLSAFKLHHKIICGESIDFGITQYSKYIITIDLASSIHINLHPYKVIINNELRKKLNFD